MSDLEVPKDEDRWVLQRARYLARDTELRQPVAEALAWRELGYSTSGIAKHLDATEATVGAQLDEVADAYGLEVLETRTDNFARDLHPADRPRGRVPA